MTFKEGDIIEHVHSTNYKIIVIAFNEEQYYIYSIVPKSWHWVDHNVLDYNYKLI